MSIHTDIAEALANSQAEVFDTRKVVTYAAKFVQAVPEAIGIDAGEKMSIGAASQEIVDYASVPHQEIDEVVDALALAWGQRAGLVMPQGAHR